MEHLDRYTATALLRQHGITPTQQRIEIAQYLFACPRHVSAEQVLSLVNDGRSRVSKATIYNALNLFSRKGLVREIIVDPTKVFYDSNISEHHHFFNTDTGELSDVPDGAIRVEDLPDLPQGTVMESIDVVIRVRSV